MVTEFTFTTTSLGSSIAPPVRLLELQSIPVLMRRLESGHWDGPMLEQICRLGRGAEGLTEILRHRAGVRALVQQFPEKPAHAAMAVQALRNFLACPLEPAHRQQFVELLLGLDTVPYLVRFLEERRADNSVRERQVALSTMAYFLKGLDREEREPLECSRQLVAAGAVPALIVSLGLEETPAKAAARVLHSLSKVDRGDSDGALRALLNIVTARGIANGGRTFAAAAGPQTVASAVLWLALTCPDWPP